MIEKPFRRKLTSAQNDGRRLVVPLVGFPGLNMTDCTIKLAQQNCGEHFRVVRALAETFEPDVIFPLMDLAVEANALGRFTVFPQAESATVPKAAFSIEELDRASRINIALDTRLLGYVETVKLMGIALPESILKGAYVTGPYSLAVRITVFMTVRLRNKKHQQQAGNNSSKLDKVFTARFFAVQFGNQVGTCQVDKTTCGKRKDVTGDVFECLSQPKREQHPENGGNSSQKVKKKRLFSRKSRVDEDSKIADFLGKQKPAVFYCNPTYLQSKGGLNLI